MPEIPSFEDVWSRDTLWKLTSATAAVAAAITVRMALEQGWQLATGREPPQNPASPFTGWGDALVWTASVGLVMGVARMLGARGAASGWRRTVGHLPPSLLAGKDR